MTGRWRSRESWWLLVTMALAVGPRVFAWNVRPTDLTPDSSMNIGQSTLTAYHEQRVPYLEASPAG